MIYFLLNSNVDKNSGSWDCDDSSLLHYENIGLLWNWFR
jgi:hypothetical protein